MDTFTKYQVDDLNQPLTNRLNKIKKNLNKNFKYYDVRKIDLDYDKHKNLYKYMKELAYLKYKRLHLVKILKKNEIDIFTQKELNEKRRRFSHLNPYHEKTYQILIYRNIFNFRYRPYALPLANEDTINKLNLTDTNIRRRKFKQKTFINPYLDQKIKYLSKISQKIENRNINLKHLKKSNSTSILLQNNITKKKPYGNEIYKRQLPKINYYNSNYSAKNDFFDTISNDNNIDDNNKRMKYNVKKCRMLILPKIQENITSTIKNSEKLERDLNIFKYRKIDITKKEEKKNENNTNILLNISPRKLYKLFFGMNKSKPKKTIKLRNKNKDISNQINIKNENKNKNIKNRNNNINKSIDLELDLENKTAKNF
jgi:hypothetical protein